MSQPSDREEPRLRDYLLLRTPREEGPTAKAFRDLNEAWAELGRAIVAEAQRVKRFLVRR